jgi:hypothetical protein
VVKCFDNINPWAPMSVIVIPHLRTMTLVRLLRIAPLLTAARLAPCAIPVAAIALDAQGEAHGVRSSLARPPLLA